MPVPGRQSIQSPPADETFQSEFLAQLLEEIRGNRIILPSLPEVALRVRKAAEDPKATAGKVAAAISTDSAMSGRLLKVANSVAYRRSGGTIEDVRSAVVRLGIPLVRTLITNLAIVQVMRAPRGSAGKYLQCVFDHSVSIATLGYALASRLRKGNPDRVMLAGMVHDIGYHPILQKAACSSGLLDDEVRLKQLLSALHPEVGAAVLELWGFSPDFIEAAREHERPYRIRTGGPDLADFLIVANLSVEHPLRAGLPAVDTSRVSAFRKLGLSPDQSVLDDDELRRSMAQAREALLV